MMKEGKMFISEMNKLKTRDEIVTLIKNHYITDNGVQLFINNVDFLIKEGIIQVKDEDIEIGLED